MAAKTITGTWDEICQRQSELQGHCLQVTILPDKEPVAEPEIPDWIMEYAMNMKNRTAAEIEDVSAQSISTDQLEYVLPPGKTAGVFTRKTGGKLPQGNRKRKKKLEH